METWLRISLLLCTFGFFREMRPSEPFVTEYLTGDYRNLTAEQVNKEIYPFGTYSVLAQLVIVFLITDILRYKPIIIVSACAGIILFAFLLWTKTILELQIGQIFYGTFMASEVAYYTYIYAKVDNDNYQVVTGHTRSAILCGKFLGGVLAQVLISTGTMDYRGLHYISFGSQIISLFIAFALPSVPKSIYFARSATTNEINATGVQAIQKTHTPQKSPELLRSIRKPTKESKQFDAILERSKTICEPTTELKPVEKNVLNVLPSDNEVSSNYYVDDNVQLDQSWRNACKLIVQHIVHAYTKPIVIQWSCWWALATCGQLQVISYVQFLWKEIDPNHESFYNGAVEATVTLLGACGAMAAGHVDSERRKNWHITILIICTLLMGAFLIISAITNLVWIAYAMYVLFGTFYFFIITIASAIIAANLRGDSFALIFGINTLVALVVQAILTLVVVTDTGYGLDARGQYMVYGSYFLVLAILYCCAVVLNYIINGTSKICVRLGTISENNNERHHTL